LATLYHRLRHSEHPAARLARGAHRAARSASLPAPRAIVRPALWAFVTARAAFYFAKRVLVVEPLWKAYCTRYGRRVRAGVFVPWVMGSGDIVLGDDVYLDGRISIAFAARFSARPTLEVGDGTGFGHNCSLSIGKRITIGRHCMIAGESMILDSSGHPVDPAQRLARRPPPPEEVRPVTIGDNVWVGTRSIILPGVTIGEGSVIAAASVVRRSVPPYSLVAGNPAKVIASLPRPDPDPAAGAEACPSGNGQVVRPG
jgi:acetyltransferase-like isoleucine patch superfamily enzyme